MKPTLYIRNTGPRQRYVHSLHAGFLLHSTHDTYREAVIEGQTVAEYGNFYVYTGEAKAPSREDQLLLEPRKRVKLVNPRLKAALLED